MRKTTYFCDRCRKEVSVKACVRIGTQVVNDKEMSKKTYDFCVPCFYVVKGVFQKALEQKDDSVVTEEKVPKTEKEKKTAKSFLDWAMEKEEKKKAEDNALLTEDSSQPGPTEEEPEKEQEHANFADTESALKEEPYVDAPAIKEEGAVFAEENAAKAERAAIPEKPDADWESEPWEITKDGPIKGAEKERIFKLHLVYGWTDEEIAKELGRLPKGIKKNLTIAAKKGDMEGWKKAFEPEIEALKRQQEEDEKAKEKAPVFSGNEIAGEEAPFLDAVVENRSPDTSMEGEKEDELVDYLDAMLDKKAAEDAEEEDGYSKKSEGAVPSYEVFEGKRYDVGGIVALARAGWKAEDICIEKGYESFIVSYFLEKYKNEIKKPRRFW